MNKIIKLNINDYVKYDQNAANQVNHILTVIQTPGAQIPDMRNIDSISNPWYAEVAKGFITKLNQIYIKNKNNAELKHQLTLFFDHSNGEMHKYIKNAINFLLDGRKFSSVDIKTHLNSISEEFYKYISQFDMLTQVNNKKLKNHFSNNSKKDVILELSSLVENFYNIKDSLQSIIYIKKILSILEDEKTFNRILSKFSARKLILVSMLLPFTDKVDAVKLYKRVYEKGFSKKNSRSGSMKIKYNFTIETVIRFITFINGASMPMVRTPEDLFKVMESSLKVEPRILMAMLGTLFIYGRKNIVVNFPKYLKIEKKYILTDIQFLTVKRFTDNGAEEKLTNFLFKENAKDYNEASSTVLLDALPGMISLKYFN